MVQHFVMDKELGSAYGLENTSLTCELISMNVSFKTIREYQLKSSAFK